MEPGVEGNGSVGGGSISIRISTSTSTSSGIRKDGMLGPGNGTIPGPNRKRQDERQGRGRFQSGGCGALAYVIG